MAEKNPEVVGQTPGGMSPGLNEKKVAVKLVLTRNPKVGKGWVYNLTDGAFLRAINPIFGKNGVVISGTFVFEEGKYYLFKHDSSSWKNRYEKFTIMTVKNEEIVNLIEFVRDNGHFKFEDERLDELMIEFTAELDMKTEDPNQMAVKVNVIDFCKFVVKKLLEGGGSG